MDVATALADIGEVEVVVLGRGAVRKREKKRVSIGFGQAVKGWGRPGMGKSFRTCSVGAGACIQGRRQWDPWARYRQSSIPSSAR